MGVKEGAGVGEYNPTIDHVNNGEEASEVVFRRPSINLENRTEALREFVDSEEIRINTRLVEHEVAIDEIDTRSESNQSRIEVIEPILADHEAILTVIESLALSALQPFPVVTAIADFTAETAKIYVVQPVLPTMNIQLPSPVDTTIITIKDMSGLIANETITVVRDGGELIDGLAQNYVIETPFESVTFVSNGVNWFLINRGGPDSDSSSGGGGELVSTLFQMKLTDTFSKTPDANVPTSLSNTTAAYSSSFKYYRISYDSGKTVTGTGTSMVLSAAPAYTVVVGDMLIVEGVARRINTIGTINSDGGATTPFVIEAAFDVDPVASACSASQTVATKDLNDFDANGSEQPGNYLFPGDDIHEVLVSLEDSTTIGDILPTFGAPNVMYSISANATDWSDVKEQPATFDSEVVYDFVPVANDELYIRFFSNKAGAGAVNLLSYKAQWFKEDAEINGAIKFLAFVRPDTPASASNCTHSVFGGKSRITFTQAYGRGLSPTNPYGSALKVRIEGQDIPRYDAAKIDLTGAYFIEIDDVTIELDTDYSATTVSILMEVPEIVIDTRSQNTERIAELEDFVGESFDNTVLDTTLIDVPFTEIVNRKQIIDPTASLQVSYATNRVIFNTIEKVEDETGPNNQQVWRAAEDNLDMIRFVGVWRAAGGFNGVLVSCNNLSDQFVEISFYGTGLNLLVHESGTVRDYRATIDGGVEGANLRPFTPDGILIERNANIYMVLPVVKGLSKGLHTVKIRNTGLGADGFNMPGYESFDETSDLTFNPGSVFIGGKRVTLAAEDTFDLTTFDVGSDTGRGGSVISYFTKEGVAKNAINPTGPAAAYLSLADHSNEKLARRYNFREFGAGSTTDFSRITGSPAEDLGFTLSDGSTTLIGDIALTINLDGLVGISCATDSVGFLKFSFTGTGLDMLFVANTAVNNANANAWEVFVDGVSVGNIPTVVANVQRKILKIASGLPFGHHTVRIQRNVVDGFSLGVVDFLVYAPKDPVIEEEHIKIGQFYKLANYIASPSVTTGAVAQGTVRKTSSRNFTYVGTWVGYSIEVANFESYLNIRTVTAASYFEYTFLGTGFEYLSRSNNGLTSNYTISVNGSSNLSGFTTSTQFTSTGLTFTAATGTVTGTATGSGRLRIRVSGLPYGAHTVRFTQNGTSESLYADCLDIIAPAFSYRHMDQQIQAEYDIGSQGVKDLRIFDVLDTPKIINWSQAHGVSVAPTTTSTTGIPIPDMNVRIRTEGGPLEIKWNIGWWGSTISLQVRWDLYINGLWVNPGLTSITENAQVTGQEQLTSYSFIVPVAAGFHNVVLYWSTNTGTITAGDIKRVLTVKELKD